MNDLIDLLTNGLTTDYDVDGEGSMLTLEVVSITFTGQLASFKQCLCDLWFSVDVLHKTKKYLSKSLHFI